MTSLLHLDSNGWTHGIKPTNQPHPAGAECGLFCAGHHLGGQRG